MRAARHSSRQSIRTAGPQGRRRGPQPPRTPLRDPCASVPCEHTDPIGWWRNDRNHDPLIGDKLFRARSYEGLGSKPGQEYFNVAKPAAEKPAPNWAFPFWQNGFRIWVSPRKLRATMRLESTTPAELAPMAPW